MRVCIPLLHCQALVARYPPGISYNEHLDAYLGEFAFRFNRPTPRPARTAFPQAHATRCSHPAYSVQTLRVPAAEANHSRAVVTDLGTTQNQISRLHDSRRIAIQLLYNM